MKKSTQNALAASLFALALCPALACVAPTADSDGPFLAFSGPGGPCISTDECDFGLRCLERTRDRVCVQPCSRAQDCRSNVCNPVGNGSVGWCEFEEVEGFVGDDRIGDEGGDPNTPPGDSQPDSEPGFVDPGEEPSPDPSPDSEPGFPDPEPDPQPEAEPDPQPDPEPEAEPEPCVFNPGSNLSRNQVVPDWSWRGVYDGQGGTRDFSFRSFACDPEFDDKSILVFMISAGWCGPCGDYMRRLGPDIAQIEAAGGTVAIVEVQDSNYSPAGHSTANSIISRYISSGAMRIGDAETLPSSGSILNSPIVSAFPQVVVVRRSDMRIVADQNSSNYVLDFVALAREHGGGGGSDPPSGSCEEESYEPNDSAGAAASISPGSFEGGVCGSDSDFYSVSINGSWRVDLSFRHSDGDIDVYLWDPNTNSVIYRNNEPIGSDSASDNESFTHSGPAVIRVLGYEGARAPYGLTLTAL